MNGQDEIIYLLKCNLDEKNKNELNENEIPKQILYHIMDIYEKSLKGYRISQMNHLIYDFESAKLAANIVNKNESFYQQNPKSTSKQVKLNDSIIQNPNENNLLDNKENVGFLYYRPTIFHYECCLKQIADYLPNEPFLVGYLIHKWETPWAKLFPLRLFLRLGEEFNTYPCALVSDRYRRSVFGEIGHTIMSLLCDTRNFQYTIAQIDGLRIQLDGSNTKITIPESQYDLIIKSLLTSNDYVFSLATLQIDDSCSSHLVAIENENLASYTSKTISYNKPNINDIQSSNKVVGAGFVVFNGALKSNLTINAKVSVIEDGIMIQIETETIAKLKQALQSMKPYYIECFKHQQVNSSINQPLTSENNSSNMISIEWTKDNRHINNGIYSIIDGRPMCGIKSLRLTNTYDYVNETKAIRWTEIYLIQIDDDINAINDNNFNLNRFADVCSQACCTALAPLLDDLVIMQQNYKNNKRYKLIKERLDQEENTPNPNKANPNQNDPLAINTKFSNMIDPFRVALRVQVSKEQVGYLLGMNGKQISQEKFLASLDNELIQILHHANTFNIGVSLEFIFHIQERFNCSNHFLNSK